MTTSRRVAWNQRLGAAGEQRVAAVYEALGFSVVDRNWRCRGGELDLVLRRGSELVFCEVKTRSSSRFGSGLEAVDVHKLGRLRRLCIAWLDAHDERGIRDVRIDVASVDGEQITLVPAA